MNVSKRRLHVFNTLDIWGLLGNVKFGTTRRDALLDMTEEDILFHMWKHSASLKLRASCWLSNGTAQHPQGNCYFQLDGDGISNNKQFTLKEQSNPIEQMPHFTDNKGRGEVIAEATHTVVMEKSGLLSSSESTGHSYPSSVTDWARAQ